MGNESTKKSSPVLKIIIAILIIAVLAVIGYGSNTYMCTRAIGNKVVLFYFCNIPDYFKLDTIKGYFIN